MDATHIRGRKTLDGLCNVVSLTGAVAFEKVTKVRIRQVHLDSDPKWSVRTDTCQTVRMTIRAGIEAFVQTTCRSALMIW
jgi:hypothetical protein